MTVQGGVIQSLSASQAEEFDPEQVGGCPRRWYFHRVDRLPVPESDDARADGDAGHALFAMHYRFQGLPKRARMLKAVRGAIAKRELPPPGPGQLVESRFDGQPSNTGERLPLRQSSTLWLGGVPWDGYVDLRFCSGDTITILDHKFSSDIHMFAKRDLLATVQMPVYALDSLRIWPDAHRVELIHNYMSRRGVDSFLVRQLVTVDQVRQRGEQIAGLVQKMQEAAAALSAEDVPGNRASCHTWTGCPFQFRCSVFKEKPKMSLSPDELEWLNVPAAAVPGATEEMKGKAVRAAEALTNIDPAILGAAVEGLYPKEKAQLKEPVGGLPASGAVAHMDEAKKLQAEHEAWTSAGLAPVGPGDDDPFAVFEVPKASVPQEQSPVCKDCGAELTAENGSQRDGKWKHVGCPAEQAPAPQATGQKCPDCPHPAHPGGACAGKRGRGACRCGVAQSAAAQLVENVTLAHESASIAAGHLPACVQNDGGKWLCVEGCVALEAGRHAVANAKKQGHSKAFLLGQADDGSPVVGGLNPPPLGASTGMLVPDLERQKLADQLEQERSMHRRTLGELSASERERTEMRAELETLRSSPPTAPATGTLQVNVNLGPETLALLQRLLGGR